MTPISTKFLVVLHLRAALLHILVDAIEFPEAFKFSSRGTQGEIPRRHVACVEVLMKPEFGRHNDGDEDPRIHKERWSRNHPTTKNAKFA